MYGADAAKIYDAQHRGRGKDYQREAKEVAAQIRQRCPGAASVLDVACGTGGHIEHYQDMFTRVEGLELAESMLAAARDALPRVPLHQGDMRDFSLERSFDAVTCLFASIAYVASPAELEAAIACMARHVVPGGVVAVEPWWFPETFLDRYVSSGLVEVDGTTIARVTHTVRDGDASVMTVHYLAADFGSGVRHFVESHRAMLFRRQQYEQAFRRAGLVPEYVPEIQCGRGLFVGVRASG